MARSQRSALAAWLGLGVERLDAVPEDVLATLVERLVIAGPAVDSRDQLAAGLRDLIRELAQGTGADPVTGLLTRRSTAGRLEEELERCRRYGRTAAIILLEVDRLVGARGGHVESLLETVAERLRRTVRTCDLVGMWAPGELVVLCPETDRVAADSLGARLHDALVEEPVQLNGSAVTLGVRVGVALSVDHGTGHSLVNAAAAEMRQTAS